MQFHIDKVGLKSRETSPLEVREKRTTRDFFHKSKEGKINFRLDKSLKKEGNLDIYKNPPNFVIQGGTPVNRKYKFSNSKQNIEENEYNIPVQRGSNNGNDYLRTQESIASGRTKSQRSSYSINNNNNLLSIPKENPLKKNLSRSGYKKIYSNNVKMRNSSFTKKIPGNNLNDPNKGKKKEGEFYVVKNVSQKN